MRSEIDEGKWYFSRIYEDIEVGIATGHAADFWDLPQDIQSYLLARFRVKGTRDAYEDMLHQRDLKQKNKQNRPGSVGRRGRY